MKCYVLAGGLSSRMGADKWSLEIGGKSFADRVISAAGSAFDEVIVVTKQGRGTFSVPVIHEANVEVAAPIIGLDCALDHAAGEACWVLGIDYPLVTADVLCYLRERFESSGAEIAVPEIASKLHMLCAGYRATTAASVKAKIASGRLALKGLVDAHKALVIPEDELVGRFGRAVLMNVNTPEDLEEARRRHAETQAG
ncbi:MAG: molybdenum cofactor guanylyltransferase [Thermoanaerobaculia bacterium]|nr:molybdenum cofactor guanylyltransferase [Thermoanaerobaculia bacterium]